MKKAVTKVIDKFTQEDFHGTLQKLLERYNKRIAAGGDYFKGDLSFMCVLSIKVLIRKKSRNLFNDPRMSITFYYNGPLKYETNNYLYKENKIRFYSVESKLSKKKTGYSFFSAS